MHLSTKGLSVLQLLLSLIAASSAETAPKELLDDIDIFARYAAFGYCEHLVDGQDVNSGTKVCTGEGIPNGCGKLGDAVVVKEIPNAQGAAGYVAVNNETQQIVVSFRGTGSPADVVTDLKTCKTSRSGRSWFPALDAMVEKVRDQVKEGIDTVSRFVILSSVKSVCSVLGGAVSDPNDPLLPMCPDCQMHTGFFEAFSGIKDTMLETVQQQKASHPDFEVVVTGYSLGAAVATLSAAYIRKAGINADLYAIGSPRVGDASFADFVSRQASQGQGKNFRVTNANDPVTNVPWADAGFAHVSPEYWFPNGVAFGEMSICNGVDNLECSGQFGFNVQEAAGGKDRMKPHLWMNYAIGFPFGPATSCPGRGGRQVNLAENDSFTEEEIAEMKRLADSSN